MRILTTVLFLFTLHELFAGGKNPRYHGNGIWTSEPQDSGVNFALIILCVFALIAMLVIILNFYHNHDKKIKALYKIITNAIPLVGIVIFIVWLIVKWNSTH